MTARFRPKFRTPPLPNSGQNNAQNMLGPRGRNRVNTRKLIPVAFVEEFPGAATTFGHSCSQLDQIWPKSGQCLANICLIGFRCGSNLIKLRPTLVRFRHAGRRLPRSGQNLGPGRPKVGFAINIRAGRTHACRTPSDERPFPLNIPNGPLRPTSSKPSRTPVARPTEQTPQTHRSQVQAVLGPRVGDLREVSGVFSGGLPALGSTLRPDL